MDIGTQILIVVLWTIFCGIVTKLNSDREDNKKDFLVLDFSITPLWFATSSKVYSKKISEMLGVGHSDCKRVEDFCNIQNMIKLNKSPELNNKDKN